MLLMCWFRLGLSGRMIIKFNCFLKGSRLGRMGVELLARSPRKASFNSVLKLKIV